MTSIHDLQRGESQQMDYLQRSQPMGQMGGQNAMMQQQMPMQQMSQQQQQIQQMQLQQMQLQQQQQQQQIPEYRSRLGNYDIPPEQPNIEDLARDIDINLSRSNSREPKEEPSEEKIVEKKKSCLLSMVPSLLREPLIIVILYVIMSQSQVRDFIGKYINQINEASQTGFVIYGAIMALLFSVAKKILIKW